MDDRLDLYTDYLLSSVGRTTATGLSRLLDGYLSHDQITRLLSGNEFTSKDLWHEVKPLVRSYETDEACLIFDDTIIPKPYMDENEIICWPWDHSRGRNEKGINLLTAFYHSQPFHASEALRVPVSCECVKKTVHYCDLKTRKEKRQSVVSKNEMMRSMLTQAVQQQHLVFRYVLADSWFSSSDNMLFIHRLKKYFLMDRKSNRLCQFAASDRTKCLWSSLDQLPLIPEQPRESMAKGLGNIGSFMQNRLDKQGRFYGRNVSGQQ
jgi:hypothetical protein